MEIFSSTQFWKNFAKTAWEKKPVLVKNFESPLREIQADDIFSMLVDYADHCRKIQKVDGFKFYVFGEMQFDDIVLQILPLKKDKTLQGYHQRMEKVFEDYCLVCDELLQVSQNCFRKLRKFTEIIFEHVGFPNRFAEMGLYLGNYRQTPFGVHVDGCGVFSFPVVGQKTFRLWSADFAAQNPSLNRAHEYSRFKKHSEIMVAKSGDMTYWPSSAWHIAESNGSFSATWSLGIWVDRTHQENVIEAVGPVLKRLLGKSGSATTIHITETQKDGQKHLPENYLKSISVLKNISDKQWHDILLKSWLALHSKNGFKNGPKIKASQNLTLASRIKIQEGNLIQWAQLKTESKTVFAFQGILVEAKKNKDLLSIIKNLNSGKECLISDFLSKKDFILINELHKAGAFEVVD